MQSYTPLTIPYASMFTNGGYAVLNEWITPEWRMALLQEAWNLRPNGTREEVEHPDSEDWRGGCPARQFLPVPGGSLLDALYHAETLSWSLQHLVGVPVRPSGQRGQFIFYSEPGDFISVHRDIEPCDAVMITCLYDNRPRETMGGTLYLYPTRHTEPLSHIRQHSARECVGVKLAIGQTLFFCGGRIPHGTIPIVPGQIRVVSTLCFHLQGMPSQAIR
jgi:hypothetical protein